MENLPRIPIADWTENFIGWLVDTFGAFFDGVTDVLEGTVDGIVNGLGFLPSILLSLIFALLAWFLSTKKIAIFSLVGFLIVDYLGYWDSMLQMLALVVISVLISIIIGVPIGIWASQKALVRKIVTPILDFMQTMPAFVDRKSVV